MGTHVQKDRGIRRFARAICLVIAAALLALGAAAGDGAMAQVSINPSTVPAGTVGASYSQTFTASGGAAPYIFSNEVGRLPNVLTITPDGLLSGTPQLATVPFEIWATDADGREARASATTTVIHYVLTLSATLPVAIVDRPYSVPISVTGGTAPYGCVLTSGALPTGLSVAPNCTIGGTPTTTGTYPFGVQATDGIAGLGNQTFVLTVIAVPPTLAYNPLPGSPVNFTGMTTVGSAGVGRIVVTPSGGAGTGVVATTTINGCALGSVAGNGAFASVAAISLNFVGATTTPQNINLSCTSGTIATTATLTCQENVGGAGNVARSWPLNCPTVPGAPTGVGIVMGGAGAAVISFTPPVSNGGAAVTQYTATCQPGNLTASAATSPITISNLLPGQTYSCTVTATNSVGTGPPSIAASISVPVLMVPTVAGWSLALLGLLVSLIGVVYWRPVALRTARCATARPCRSRGA